jgi:hypothetical protein
LFNFLTRYKVEVWSVSKSIMNDRSKI